VNLDSQYDSPLERHWQIVFKDFFLWLLKLSLIFVIFKDYVFMFVVFLPLSPWSSRHHYCRHGNATLWVIFDAFIIRSYIQKNMLALLIYITECCSICLSSSRKCENIVILHFPIFIQLYLIRLDVVWRKK